MSWNLFSVPPFRATKYMCCIIGTVHLKSRNISMNHQRRSEQFHFLVKGSTLKRHYLMLRPLQPGSACFRNGSCVSASYLVKGHKALVVHSTIWWLNTIGSSSKTKNLQNHLPLVKQPWGINYPHSGLFLHRNPVG